MTGMKLTFDGRESSFHQELGRFLTVMTSSAIHSRLAVSYFKLIVEPSIRHRQYRILFDERGNPLGYVIWAALANDVHERMLGGAAWQLHISEWNEGEYFWIVDFVSPGGYLRDFMEMLKAQPSFAGSQVFYRRARRGRVVTKSLLL